MKKIKTNRSQFISVLKIIKSENDIDDEPTKRINNIINAFSNEAELSENVLFEILLYKRSRNYKVHGIIEDYINDVFYEECIENDLIWRLKN
jgi:hypothetical protein